MQLCACDERVASTAAEVRKAVKQMLAACEVYEPPTPLARLLEHRALSVEERRKLVPSRFQQLVRFVGHKIRGILDLRARHIAVDTTLHRHRQTFLTHHEIAHDVLDWHRELFVHTTELDLLPSARRSFEAEANYFAALSIFQVDRFAKEQRGVRLALKDLAGVAARYGASLTATIRQYVSVQDLPTALLQGRAVRGRDGRYSILFYQGLANARFIQEFGSNLFDAGFGSHEAATAVLNERCVPIAEEEREVTDARGETRTLVVETFSNGYGTFTLVHPKVAARRRFAWPRIRASA